MEKGTVTRWFLGANTPKGFCSVYNGLADPEGGDFLWVIKGGPGCGKSTFMRKIGEAAEAAGQSVAYIQCSGDPASLDGVYIPEKRMAYVDGTAPHTVEAVCPGAAALYLDLGRFYDRQALSGKLPLLAGLNRDYKALYKRAYDLLAAERTLDLRDTPGLTGEKEVRASTERAAGAANREFGKSRRKKSRVQYAYLSAVCCEGELFLEDSFRRLCGRVWKLDDMYGLAEPYLRELERQACRRGLDLILCPDPTAPEYLDTLILPELSLGFTTRALKGEISRHVRLDALVSRQLLREKRPELRTTEKLRRGLMDSAVQTLARAKALHDELERIYNPHVDFRGVNALAEKHVEQLLA